MISSGLSNKDHTFKGVATLLAAWHHDSFCGCKQLWSGKVGIVSATIHLGILGSLLLFPPKMVSGWKQDDF